MMSLNFAVCLHCDHVYRGKIKVQYLTKVLVYSGPLNYGYRGTTLKCPQSEGVLYTESAPGNVSTNSKCRMPRIQKLSVHECSLSAERFETLKNE